MRSRYRTYTCTIEVTVTDAKRLIQIARDKAETAECPRGTIKDAADAIQWLLDESAVFDGTAEIDHSACELQLQREVA